MTKPKEPKETAKVKLLKAKVAKLGADFDLVVAELKSTPMTKAEYDLVERKLYGEVESMLAEAQQL